MRCVFYVKQKTAYELRISDWSSDVCSSDLEPRPRTAKEAYATAKEHFEERLPFAASMMKSFRLHLDDNELRQAAFLLHQAIEHGYSGLLLTLTNYAPPSHNIKFLRSLAEEQDRSLVEAWPREQSTQSGGVRTRVGEGRRVEALEARWSGDK